jgi:fatty acid desaturase
MGDSKRRKAALGDKYGKEEKILPWLPITKTQADQFYKVTTRGAWVGIGMLAAVWVTIRFVGPAFGWWDIQ